MGWGAHLPGPAHKEGERILFDKEWLNTISLKGDYSSENDKLAIDSDASDVLTKYKNNKRFRSYLLDHRLVKTCFGVPGIPDGTKVLLTSSRDAMIDPLGQIPLQSGQTIKKYINDKCLELAHEQQHKAEENKNTGILNTAQILLAAAALILFMSIALVAMLSRYSGG